MTDEGHLVQNQQAATEKYQRYSLGMIPFDKPGKHMISVSLEEGDSKETSLKADIVSPIQ